MTGDLVKRLRSHDYDHAYNLKTDEELYAERDEAADLIEQLEREKAVVSDLWEQQKEIALDYLADCNKAIDRIAALEAENRDQHNDILNRIKRELDKADRIAALEAKLAEKDALLRECGEALGAISRAVGDWDCRIYASDTEMRHVRTTLAKIKDATDG